eukprot:TRINITY_DN18241_c0_g1_i1.p1 TRINITY_DN18241_c0_g1~~TRINITY_DN18241_c0_g1_i1.p1  ORF type:complete len:843 (+),score=137.70 TRINITY_DN18241_c0_g1_i1:94-2622(+)
MKEKIEEESNTTGGCPFQVSVKVLFALAGSMIGLLAVASVWVPASIMASEALEEARHDQMISNTLSTARQVTNYFQTASSSLKQLLTSYENAFAIDPNNAMRVLIKEHGSSAWSLMANSHTLASIVFQYNRDPAEVAKQSPENRVCDVDSFLLSTGYKSLMFNTTTAGYDNMTCIADSASCVPGQFRMTGIAGSSDLANPLRVTRTMFHRTCLSTLGNKETTWTLQRLPGDPATNNTGITGPFWPNSVIVVGKPPNDSLYKKIFAPIPAPSWAPFSGFVAVSQRVGARLIVAGVGGVTITNILEKGANSTSLEDNYMIITGRGELMATSEGIDVEHREHKLLGLHMATNASAMPQKYWKVASYLVNKYCTGPVNGGRFYSCDWAGQANANFGRVIKVSSFFVSINLITDSQADGLDLLLVNFVPEDEILKPANELNDYIMIVALCSIVFFAAVSYIMTGAVAGPIKLFTNNIMLSSVLKFEDILLPKQSIFSEFNVMNQSLKVLVSEMIYYRAFIPTVCYADEEKSEPESEASNEEKDSEELSASRSSGSDLSRIRVAKRQTNQIEESMGVIVAVNARAWTTRSMKVSLQHYQQQQNSFVDMLSAIISPFGSINYASGDRALLSVLKPVSMHAEVLCQNALEKATSAQELVPGLIIGIRGGKIIRGIIGNMAYRSNIVAGPIVTSVTRLVGSDTCCKDFNPSEPSVLIGNELAVVIASKFKTLPLGRLTVKTLEEQGVSNHSTRLHLLCSKNRDNGCEEWMYEMEKKDGSEEYTNLIYDMIKEYDSGKAFQPGQKDRFTKAVDSYATSSPDIPWLAVIVREVHQQTTDDFPLWFKSRFIHYV